MNTSTQTILTGNIAVSSSNVSLTDDCEDCLSTVKKGCQTRITGNFSNTFTGTLSKSSTCLHI